MNHIHQYIISFFLGICIAFAALVFQVALTTIFDLFSGTSYALHYDETLSFHTWSLLIFAACSEEIIRAIIITQRTKAPSISAHPITHGFLLGIGFGALELYLYQLDHANLIFSYILLIPLSLHIMISIFLCYGFAHNNRTDIRALMIIGAICIHILGNIIIFTLQ